MAATRRTGSTGRFYDIDGQSLPSVTTILSVIAKPALVKWAEKTATEEVVNAAADLYADMAKASAGKPLSRPGYITTLTQRLGKQRQSARATAKAQEIGSQTHALIEWTLHGMMGHAVGPRPETTPPAEWAFTAWQDWAQSVHLKPLYIEQVVCSVKHGYAGTLDLLAEVNGKRTLIDWKTSKSVYAEYHLQNVAYQAAVEEMGHGAVEGGMLVRLPKVETDPAFEVVEVGQVDGQSLTRDALLATFHDCIRLWRWWHAAEEAGRAAWFAKKGITPKAAEQTVEAMATATPF